MCHAACAFVCENLQAMAVAVHCIAPSAVASRSSPRKAAYAEHYFSRDLPRRPPTYAFSLAFLFPERCIAVQFAQRGLARTPTPHKRTVHLYQINEHATRRNTHARPVAFFLPPLHSPTQTNFRTSIKSAGTRIPCHDSIKKKFTIYASFVVEPCARHAEYFLICGAKQHMAAQHMANGRNHKKQCLQKI